MFARVTSGVIKAQDGKEKRATKSVDAHLMRYLTKTLAAIGEKLLALVPKNILHRKVFKVAVYSSTLAFCIFSRSRRA